MRLAALLLLSFSLLSDSLDRRYAYLLPIILTLTMGLTMVIVSYFVDRNNRNAFVNKKVRFTFLLFLFLLLIYTLLTLDCAPSLRSLARLQDKGRPL